MDPSAIKLLARTADAYARCTTYRDTGEVVTDIHHPADPSKDRTIRKPFSTLFVRPSTIRYEFSYDQGKHPGGRWTRFVVWGDESESRSWWSNQPGVRSSTSLFESLAGAAGISDRSSWRVPSLLLAYKEMDDGPAPETAALRLDTGPSGAVCHVLAGTARSGSEVELWIDAETALLCRVRSKSVHDQASRDATLEQRASDPRLSPAESYRLRVLTAMGGGTYWRTTTTTYAAEIDTPIAAEALAFAPPG